MEGEQNYAKFKIQEVIYNLQMFGLGNPKVLQYVSRPYTRSSTLLDNLQEESSYKAQPNLITT